MNIIILCIQCKDKSSGVVGSFGFSPEAKFVAITPVCQHFEDLNKWLKEMKYTIDYHNPEYPCGVAHIEAT